MSQNRTVIQGLEPAGATNHQNQGVNSQSFYQRGEQRPINGTVVPGMMGKAQQSDNQAPYQPNNRAVSSGKPVIGFLYSISRTAAGEYWPLHVGQNTIGKSENCDIILPEGTISSEHAVLVVRKLKKPEKIIASICDSKSTNGTMLNDTSLGFEPIECHNGDILTFGDNYQVLLLLIDATQLGLAVNPDFIEIEPSNATITGQDDPFVSDGPTRPGIINDFPPFFDGYTNSGVSGGTVGMDGTSGMPQSGGTVGM